MLSPFRSFHRAARDERGNAAVEFAFVAPVLAFCCIAVVDLGFALNQRMAADHVLRIGADAAMSDPGQTTVQNVLEQTAAANFSKVAGQRMPTDITSSSDTLYIQAERFCSCPESKLTKIDCSQTCGGKPPLAFYQMSAAKQYSGILLPANVFRSTLQVEVR
jgi:pilus assembly protein CpaE